MRVRPASAWAEPHGAHVEEAKYRVLDDRVLRRSKTACEFPAQWEVMLFDRPGTDQFPE